MYMREGRCKIFWAFFNLEISNKFFVWKFSKQELDFFLFPFRTPVECTSSFIILYEYVYKKKPNFTNTNNHFLFLTWEQVRCFLNKNPVLQGSYREKKMVNFS